MPTDESQLSVASAFFQPLSVALTEAKHRRHCPSLSDEYWVRQGVLRVTQSIKSGREFLQSYYVCDSKANDIASSLYFQSLHSKRRLAHARSCLDLLIANIDKTQIDPFSELPELDEYDIHAGDGHFHAALVTISGEQKAKSAPPVISSL